MVRHNVEQFITLLSYNEEKLLSGDPEMRKVISEMAVDDFIVFYSTCKCYTLLQDVKNRACETNVVEEKLYHTADEVRLIMWEASKYIEKCLVCKDCTVTDKVNAIKEATRWDDSLVTTIGDIASTLAYRDMSTGLQCMSNFIIIRYKEVLACGITDMERRVAKYVNTLCLV